MEGEESEDSVDKEMSGEGGGGGVEVEPGERGEEDSTGEGTRWVWRGWRVGWLR